MGWSPNYQSEARIYARYILKERPSARIAVLYQNDDYGKDYLKGLKDGLGAKAASMIVAEEAYDVSEPTIDSHVVKMRSLGADVFVNITTAKFAAQAIRKAAEIGWKPLHFLNNVSASIGSVIRPAGVENAQGIISVAYLMDALDSQWKGDPGMKAFDEFLAKDFPEGNRADDRVMVGYNMAQTLAQVLKQCGDNLMCENVIGDNVMSLAANFKDFCITNLLPGITINTSPIDFAPIKQVQFRRFKGRDMGAIRSYAQR
jgi:branched-chain amino acid transport system substrate-binding protein